MNYHRFFWSLIFKGQQGFKFCIPHNSFLDLKSIAKCCAEKRPKMNREEIDCFVLDS